MKGHLQRTKFESSVISYGSQTNDFSSTSAISFESSVISYGSQTAAIKNRCRQVFESSVISYGSQTNMKGFIYYKMLK